MKELKTYKRIKNVIITILSIISVSLFGYMISSVELIGKYGFLECFGLSFLCLLLLILCILAILTIDSNYNDIKKKIQKNEDDI